MGLDFGRLGFGFLRLPHTDPNDITDVDLETTKAMVDCFLQRGFRYFDTAYIYLNGKSEECLRKALVERHPRDAYMVCTKLPCGILKKGKTAEEIFEEQLERCGLDFFDVYLLHGLDEEDAAFAEEQGCFDFLQKQKEKGKVRYTGFSFHDTADVLDRILTRHPEVDVVQIQLNYLDWDNPIIQSGKCYEICRKHGKPIIVMEPVKGGTLASIPEKAAALLEGEAPAHRAIRFAASQEGVETVLSGMSAMEQVEENTELMASFVPLSSGEQQVLAETAQIIRSAVAIPCTGCAYCLEECPAGIPIPQYFSLYNERKQDGWQANAESRYQTLTEKFSPAGSCVSCGRCETHCPQKISIRQMLVKVSEVFDK